MTAMPALLSRPDFEVEIGAPVPFHIIYIITIFIYLYVLTSITYYMSF